MSDTEIEPISDEAPPETPWGFMENGVFVVLPKGPMKHLGPPPFDIVMWNDITRHIIEQPA